MTASSKNIHLILETLIKFFPILIILGPLALNCFSLIFSIYAIFNLKSFKHLNTINFKTIIFFFTFIIFLFPYSSLDFHTSLFKYLSYFRFILMLLGIIIFLENHKLNKGIFSEIYRNFVLILIVIIIDVLIEFYTGSNLFGFSTDYNGRIASFTNDELIIGYIFTFVSLFTLLFIYNKTNSITFFSITIFLFFISFIIGERSNFLKLFSLIILFYGIHFFYLKKIKIKKILAISTIIISVMISFFIFSKDTTQSRKFFNTFKNVIVVSDKKIDFRIRDEFFETRHAAHYITAYKIFLNHPISGIGIDSFYLESKKKEYKIEGYLSQSTHPHQIYLEILSEVGLLGFLYFMFIFFYPINLFFKNINKQKNLNAISNFLLHIFFIFPILPSGSFFGTNYGIPFWFNLSIFLYLLKKKLS